MNYAETADAIPEKLGIKELNTAFNDLEGELGEEEQARLDAIVGIVSNTTDFFTAPASAKFHLNQPTGLYRHSLGVTYRLFALDTAYDLFSVYSRFEVLLCGLLHDLGKAGQVALSQTPTKSLAVVAVGKQDYEYVHSPYYVQRALKTKPGEFEYRRNTERIVMSIPEGSLHFIGTLLGDYWKPSPTAWAAIAYHDGQYVPEGSHVKQAETKLGLALHHADIWQSRSEGGWENGSGWRG